MVTTMTDPLMIHILIPLGLTVVMDLSIPMSGNADVTNWWTNQEGRSDDAIQVTLCDTGSNIHIRIAE